MATTTNYGWTTPDDTALVKDGAAAIRTLGTSVDTTTKNLNPETTLGDISYRSSTSNVNTRLPLGTAGQVLKVNSGATAPEWATDASGMTNPMTTTGDTIYSSSGSTPARLGIGSTGQVLTVAAGVPSWATPSSGGMTSIASGTLSGSSVNLSSISGSYNNLQLIIRNFKPNTDGEAFRFRVNGVSSANTWANSSNNTDSAKAFTQDQMTSVGNADNAVANGLIVVNFYDYANTSTWKMIEGLYMWNYTADTTQINWQRTTSFYNDASAISSIQLILSSGTFTSGSYILYGVK
jgi:hypothetical protein